MDDSESVASANEYSATQTANQNQKKNTRRRLLTNTLDDSESVASAAGHSAEYIERLLDDSEDTYTTKHIVNTQRKRYFIDNYSPINPSTEKTKTSVHSSLKIDTTADAYNAILNDIEESSEGFGTLNYKLRSYIFIYD